MEIEDEWRCRIINTVRLQKAGCHGGTGDGGWGNWHRWPIRAMDTSGWSGDLIWEPRAGLPLWLLISLEWETSHQLDSRGAHREPEVWSVYRLHSYYGETRQASHAKSRSALSSHEMTAGSICWAVGHNSRSTSNPHKSTETNTLPHLAAGGFC
jgi:hypothetical protein